MGGGTKLKILNALQ